MSISVWCSGGSAVGSSWLRPDGKSWNEASVITWVLQRRKTEAEKGKMYIGRGESGEQELWSAQKVSGNGNESVSPDEAVKAGTLHEDAFHWERDM